MARPGLRGRTAFSINGGCPVWVEDVFVYSQAPSWFKFYQKMLLFGFSKHETVKCSYFVTNSSTVPSTEHYSKSEEADNIQVKDRPCSSATVVVTIKNREWLSWTETRDNLRDTEPNSHLKAAIFYQFYTIYNLHKNFNVFVRFFITFYCCSRDLFMIGQS